MPLPLRHPGALVAILLVLPELAAAAERCAVPAGHIAAVEDLVEVAAGADWTRLALGEPLCVGDTLRAGENGRSAVILNSGAVLRLAPGTTLRIEQAQPGERTLLQLITGIASFFSRRPHALEIDTPFADAAVEGTEFTLEVEPDRSRVTVLEGRVRFGNPLGTVRVAPGEAAVAVAGRAPELELRIRPRDAVQWALYYPPLPETRLPAAAPAPLREAARLAAQGRRTEALARLDQLPPPARDTTALTLRAELLLAQGRPAEAETALAEALARDPRNADALALRAVIAVARNMKDQALADAREAVTLDPANPRARLALSYAAQAAFDIPQARESLEAAAASTPDDALIQARLAEVQLMQGDTRAARRSATRALELDPANPRAQTVAGFVALARIDTRTAHATFTRAIELDPFNPLAHLGRGLATIRDGNLEAGRANIELAVALDPDNALLRSYLGKAYLEDRRESLAASEFATAKALDPNDPTPWWYEAIGQHLQNRPVEALRSLELGIARSENRAVYRTPELLNEDRASQGASLGVIYNELGFGQLGLQQASRAIAADPGSPAAHRFLADIYARRKRAEIGRVSELLQAQLLDSLGTAPIPPSLAITDLASIAGAGRPDVSFNEYTRLFERDGVSAVATGLVGTDGVRADEVIGTVRHSGFVASASQLHSEAGGFRRNNEFDNDVYNLFAQSALSPSLSVQAEYLRRVTSQGDLELDFDTQEPGDDRTRIQEDQARAGLRWAPDASSALLASWLFEDRRERLSNEIEDVEAMEAERGDQGELRYLVSARYADLTIGGGRYRYDLRSETPDSTEPNEDSYSNGEFGYGYVTLFPRGAFQLTAGLGLDWFRQGEFELDRTLPKLGLRWQATDNLTIRAAAYQTLRRGTYAEQTLEPTELGAFGQFYDDLIGTEAKGLGVGADYRVSPTVALGIEASGRSLEVPIFSDTESAPRYAENWRERQLAAYAYVTLDHRWTLGIEPSYERFEREVSEIFFSIDGQSFRVTDDRPTAVTLWQMPVSARYMHPSGVFGMVRTTAYRQKVDREDELDLADGTDSFLLVDSAIGYRFPRRTGELRLELTNLFDRHFSFQDENFRTNETRSPALRPERLVMLRGSVSF